MWVKVGETWINGKEISAMMVEELVNNKWGVMALWEDENYCIKDFDSEKEAKFYLNNIFLNRQPDLLHFSPGPFVGWDERSGCY